MRRALLLPLLLPALAACKSTGAPLDSSANVGPAASGNVAAMSDSHEAGGAGFTPNALPAPANAVSDDDLAADARASNAFATTLYSSLRSGSGNLFFSPPSIRIALGMTYVGARGDTASEMQRALSFGDVPHTSDVLAAALRDWNQRATPPADGGAPARPADVLHLADKIWGQKDVPFQPAFLDVLASQFAAPLETLDFRNATEPSRQAINAWVDASTEHRIQELVPRGALGRDTRLVVTNAVYFKGTWSHEFRESATQPGPFFVLPAKTVQASLMEQTEPAGYAETPDAKILELGYASGKMAMIIALPNDKDGLGKLESSLTADTLLQWRSAIGPDRVHVVLPRFKTTSSFDLGHQLAALGMPSAFDRTKADFSGMDGARDISIAAVLHKAFVAVDEKGTEAAAATAVVMRAQAMRREAEPKEFRADHPFVFFLVDKVHGHVLFMGRVADPTG